MVGRKVSRFSILEELGRGGMATVWRARDDLLGRLVAVKLLDEALTREASGRRRFRREAEIAAGLEHPSIVPVYEAGESGELVYIVMKLIEGETLAQLAARRLPPLDLVLDAAAAVASALDYAHARGVIHRDVSPRNIMRTPSGAVYVLDFGLAHVAGRTETSSGHFAGTVPYLPPEVLLGGKADARSDLYSLGVVLYEALAGARPFPGERLDEIRYQTQNLRPAPPSRLRPELPSEVDALILRLLSWEPAARPASAAELAADLARLRAPRAAEPAAEAPRPRRTPPAGAAADGAADLGRKIAAGHARTYLAVLPIEADEADLADPGRARLLRGLHDAVRAGLAELDRVHVVGEESWAPGESGRGFARRAGANLLLRWNARFTAAAVRVGFALVEPEACSQVAGGSADGSVYQPFDLEDRVVQQVRRALGLPEGAGGAWHARPRDPAAQERFAQALGYLRRFDQEALVDGAIGLLEGLLASEGESAAVHAALARACLHKFRRTRERVWESRAERSCHRALELDPHAPEVLLALGELHTAAGRAPEGIAELDRALALQSDYYEAHLARARALDGAERTAEAEEECRRTIGLRPSDWRGHHELGLVLFRHGRVAEALEPWEKVAALVPDNASAHRNLGSALFTLGRLEAAVEAFRRANQIRPDTIAYYSLGTALFLLGRHDECVAALEKAVALTPSDPWAWGNLGNACRWIPGREQRMREASERAVALLRERLDREPGEGKEWAQLAGWLNNLGRDAEAEAALRTAIERSPDDLHVVDRAGKTLLRLGKREEALAWLRRAVERGVSVASLRRSPELRPLAGDSEFERILELGGRNGSVEP